MDVPKDQLDVLRNQTAQERRMRANVALKISENIAQERESLVKELDMLRSLNTKVSLNWILTFWQDDTHAKSLERFLDIRTSLAFSNGLLKV